MSIPALLNVALLSARKGAAEIEFAVKKVHTLDVTKKGPADYTTALILLGFWILLMVPLTLCMATPTSAYLYVA